MKNPKILPSTCKNCRAYQLEGRRGGFCQLFAVPVQSQWKSCSLAAFPFENILENSWQTRELEFHEISEVIEASFELTS
ncbi:MAG: hypothetical protein AAFO04_07030 [Cyanobacteria bacterium J06592_8]